MLQKVIHLFFYALILPKNGQGRQGVKVSITLYPLIAHRTHSVQSAKIHCFKAVRIKPKVTAHAQKQSHRGDKMPKQSCNWCFTVNNPSKVRTCGEKDKFKDLTFDTDEKLINFIRQYDEVNYYVFQRERGHNENTEHIQGFIQFRNRRTCPHRKNMIK